MSSSIGSLHEKPVLPAELSLDLGSLKARKEKLEQPPPLWKRNQEPILFATNRVSNIPSYVPRFSKVFNQTDIKHIEDAYNLNVNGIALGSSIHYENLNIKDIKRKLKIT